MRARRYTFIVFLSVLSMLGFSSLYAALPASAAVQTSSPYTIVSGVPWTDTSGQLIQGHGGGIIQVGSKYYWIGQDNRSQNGVTNRTSMACYSSTDLIHWDFVSDVLTDASPGFSTYIAPNFTAGSVLNRPKVLYNKLKDQYVMYVDVAYGTSPRSPDEFQVAVATSSAPCGGYSYVEAPFQPLGNPSGDIGLYQENGTGYLLSEDTGNPDHCTACPTCGTPTPSTAACSVAGLYIYQLSPDFLSVVSVAHQFSQDYEAPALFKAPNGTYFVLASGKTGWAPNDNQYATASALTGTWSTWHTFAPSGSNTEISQTMSVLPVSGKKGTTDIYLGDRWNASDLGDSTYVWQPLTTSGTTLTMPQDDSWSINVTAGTSVDDGEPYFYLTNLNSGKVLEEDGTNTDQGDLNGGTNQQWQIAGFNYAGPGNIVPHYMIVNRSSTDSSGKDMVLESQSSSPGASVGLGTWSGGTNSNQEWIINSVNGGPDLQFVNVGGSGLVLSVASASTTSGASIDQETNTTAQSQQWGLTEVPGFWAFNSGGNLINRGGVPWLGSPAADKAANPSIVGMAVTPDGNGYWLLGSGGTVYNYGDAAPVSPISVPNCNGHSDPFTGITGDPAGGFWAFTACGHVENEAGASWSGSPSASGTGATNIVGMAAAAADGKSYWLAGAKGTVYNYGTDAAPVNPISVPNCNGHSDPFTGITGDPAGGFWAFTACGHVESEAGAPWSGSPFASGTGATNIFGMAATADGNGYWLADGTTGTVYNYGDATGDATGSTLSGVANLTGLVGDPSI